jgi:hypothetical protein
MTDRLIENFEGSPMPPVKADGSLDLTPAPTTPITAEPISRCQLGPCFHYHELTSRMDAQQPIDGSKTHLPVFVSRTCYPTPGIEFDLTEPVKDCSLWYPMDKADRAATDRRRGNFMTLNPELMQQFEASWSEGGDDGDCR